MGPCVSKSYMYEFIGSCVVNPAGCVRVCVCMCVRIVYVCVLYVCCMCVAVCEGVCVCMCMYRRIQV